MKWRNNTIRDDLWDIVKLVLILVFMAWVCFGVVGCASVPLTHDQCNATRYPTAEEHEQCLRAATKYAQEQYDKADARNVRREKLCAYIRGCIKSQGYTLVTFKLSRFEKQVLDRYAEAIDVNTLPRSLSRANFACLTDDDLQRAINEIGY